MREIVKYFKTDKEFYKWHGSMERWGITKRDFEKNKQTGHWQRLQASHPQRCVKCESTEDLDMWVIYYHELGRERYRNTTMLCLECRHLFNNEFKKVRPVVPRWHYLQTFIGRRPNSLPKRPVKGDSKIPKMSSGGAPAAKNVRNNRRTRQSGASARWENRQKLNKMY